MAVEYDDYFFPRAVDDLNRLSFPTLDKLWSYKGQLIHGIQFHLFCVIIMPSHIFVVLFF